MKVRPLFISKVQAWLTVFFSVLPSSRRPVMSTAQIHCPGCNKIFTPSGYSQHVARTPDALCRFVLQMMDTHPLPASRFIPGAASSLAPNSSSTSQILRHTSVGEAYGMAPSRISDETPALIERTGSTTHATQECTSLSTHEPFLY